MKSIIRRKLLVDTAAIAVGAVISRSTFASTPTPTPTPRAAEGPFYPRSSMRFDDSDNDLVKVSDAVKEAGGEIIYLHGRILSAEGAPQKNHRIEIWQCDVNGKYLHSGDRRSVIYDSGFQGFGHDISDDKGRYSFRTIRPTRYPGRTPHIHVKVHNGERELLTTQFYIKDEPDNERDSIFRRLSSDQAKRVSLLIAKTDDKLQATIDVVI